MQAVAGFPKREVKAIGLIGFAHMLSHLYMLAFAPLAGVMIADLNIDAIGYGLALTVFAISTGIFQTPMGLLIERIGGKPVLIFGLFVNSLAFCLIAWVSEGYFSLLLFMALAGLGNSVFHPADYSLISASVGDERIGKAFSIHTFVGHVGFIAGPLITAGLEPFVGWRGALAAIGLIGLAMTLILILFGGAIEDGRSVKKKAPVMDSLRDLLSSKPVLLFFLFYMLSSMANFGMTQFSVLAFQPVYEIEKVVAVAALSAYQIGALLLVIPGGILADRVHRYDLIMLVGFGVSALMILLSGTGWLPFWVVIGLLCVAGGLRGGVNASRDVAVRHVAGTVPIGTVFGFVSTGFLVGQGLAGFVYGWLYETFPPHYVFYASAAFSVLGMMTVLINSGTRRPAEAVGE